MWSTLANYYLNESLIVQVVRCFRDRFSINQFQNKVDDRGRKKEHKEAYDPNGSCESVEVRSTDYVN